MAAVPRIFSADLRLIPHPLRYRMDLRDPGGNGECAQRCGLHGGSGAKGVCIEALRKVSFEVEDAFSAQGRDIGEFRVLLGPSGCGKSTLLRMIAGLDRPDSGQVLVNGKPVDGPGRDRGMVFQKYTSFPWLTVADNIAYGPKINGVPAPERQRIVDHLIEAVGLACFA